MPDELTVADYEVVLAEHRRLVRQLDVLLNGTGAAKQATLCDIVSQLERQSERIDTRVLCHGFAEPNVTSRSLITSCPHCRKVLYVGLQTQQ